MAVAPPSGEQWEIRRGAARATVVEVGGGLREYEVDGEAVLDPFPLEAVCDGAHNMPLVPWPNRIRDGRYSFEGEDYRLELSEPALGNAIHGFGRWRNWTLREREADRLVVGLPLHPQPGYPFALDLAIEYSLDGTGLSARAIATNVGTQTCPYGFGQHAYLRCGTETIDQLILKLEAERWLPTDERQIPVGSEPTAHSAYDFRAGRKIGAQKIDQGFTALTRGADGKVRISVASPQGRRVELWADENFSYVQIYTGDTLAPERRRRGLAVEPMTCAPNAFVSGDGLVRLAPGESLATAWGLVAG